MTQNIEFNSTKYLTPQQVLRIPLIAQQRGFASPDDLLADLVKRDLFPESKPAKRTREQKGASK